MTLLNVSLKFKSHRFFHLFIPRALSLTVFILILFIHISMGHSAEVTFAWDQNCELDLAGYRIYEVNYGISEKYYTMLVDIIKDTTPCLDTVSYKLSGLQNGKTYYFASTAYDTEGYESGFSNELCFPCTYSISPISQSFPASGGAGTVSVTTQSNGIWTASSNASWLVITSNSSMMGNGVVNYTVLANTDVSSRTGTLTIAGQTFTVNQSGVSQYTLTITKAGSGSGTVTNHPTGTAFSIGTVVTLTATPDANSTFAGWWGGCMGNSLTCTITINGNVSVTAIFTLTSSPCSTPGTPSNPFPQQGATGVSTSPTLSWSACAGTNSYDVYFGTSSNPPYVGNTTGTSYPRSGLKSNTLHYWKIVAKNNCSNLTSGPGWSFTTGSVSSLPDLTGQWNSLSQTCRTTSRGTKCTLKGKFAIQNIGNKDVSSSTVKFYLSDNNSYDQGDTLLKQKSIRNINASGSMAIDLSINLPTGQTASNKYSIAVIDADNTIVESNEANNQIVFGPIP